MAMEPSSEQVTTYGVDHSGREGRRGRGKTSDSQDVSLPRRSGLLSWSRRERREKGEESRAQQSRAEGREGWDASQQQQHSREKRQPKKASVQKQQFICYCAYAVHCREVTSRS